jgi:hypothetical protein
MEVPKMDAILSMPLPFASALIVLMLVAAFFFIKFLALALAPSSDVHYVVRCAQPERNGHDQHRRATDRGVALS